MIREIPKTYEHACDCCGEKRVRGGRDVADGWIIIKAIGQKVTYPGQALEKLLCASCGELTLQAIERVEPKAKAPT